MSRSYAGAALGKPLARMSALGGSGNDAGPGTLPFFIARLAALPAVDPDGDA